MTDDIKALIEDLRSWADACGARPGDGAFAIGAHDGKLSFVEKTRPSSGDLQRLLTATLREAATALDAREKVKTVRSPRAVRRKALLEAAAVAAGYSDQAQAAILALIPTGGGDD